MDTGVAMGSEISPQLLVNIFVPNTPLHDGAVIIQGDKVACASSYFPPTSVNLSSRYGARHRAALGIAEVSDALTIVVSEETSAISIAENGRIFSVDEKQLKDYLRRVICNDEIAIEKNSRNRNSLVIEEDNDMVFEKTDDESVEKRFLSRTNRKNKDRDMKVPLNNRAKYEGKNTPFSKKEENSDEIIIDDKTNGEVK